MLFRYSRYRSHRWSQSELSALLCVALFVAIRACFVSPNSTKTVLLWTTFHGKDFSIIWQRHKHHCPLRDSCRFTLDRDFYEASDAVLFHTNDVKAYDLPDPKLRKPSQHFVFFSVESPLSIEEVWDHFILLPNFYFNTSMTYQSDSDVTFRYAKVLPRGSYSHFGASWYEYDFGRLEKAFHRKSKPVAWFTSHCKTPARRELYVKELSKHIKVDIFGSCNGTECPLDAVNCTNLLTNDYFFALTLENSICPEYVTEKLFDALRDEVVIPIVMKRSIAEEFVSGSAFIAADDFQKPIDMANFLKALTNDKERYLQYFEWNRRQWITSSFHFSLSHITSDKIYENSESMGESLCDLCHYLHNYKPMYNANADIIPKVIDLKRYWMNANQCYKNFTQLVLLSEFT